MKFNMDAIQGHFKTHDKDPASAGRDVVQAQAPMNRAQNASALRPQEPLPPHQDWPMPKLRIHVEDLLNPGAVEFFVGLHPTELMRDAVLAVLKTLYTPETCPRHVRSVTLVVENMGGVAHTNGTQLDDDHKEIHLSMSHISNNKKRAKEEIRGVVVHEMVHCFQYNGKGTCPGGLIEGVADFVRLRAQLGPPHWKRGGNKWDEGYQSTAFFLDWIDGKYGEGSVVKLNESLRQPYRKEIFQEVTGKDVDTLWNLYKDSLQQKLN